MASQGRLISLAVVAALVTACVFATQSVGDHWHTACVGNGLVHGSSTTDGAMHSRVLEGCGAETRYCDLYGGQYSTYLGGEAAGGAYGNCSHFEQASPECKAFAYVKYIPSFNWHAHLAHYWCG